MARLTSAQLQAKIAAKGIQKSESPVTTEVLGSILTSSFGLYTSKKGNTYFTLDGYLIAVKKEETLAKEEVTITCVECIKDFGNMKVGDKFLAAE